MKQWVITFKAADRHDPPAEIRVRSLLKVALRRCGLRCVDVREQAIEEGNAREKAKGKTREESYD